MPTIIAGDIAMSYLSVNTVAKRYQVSRATIWRWVKEGHFPEPTKLASNTTRWELSALEKWENRGQQF